MSGATTPCVHCGATVPTPEAFMDAEGAVCADCNASAEMGESFAKAYKSLAIGTLSSALVSFCFNPFLVFTIMSFASGFATLSYPGRLDPEDRQALQTLQWPVPLALVSMVLAVAAAGMRLLPLMAR